MSYNFETVEYKGFTLKYNYSTAGVSENRNITGLNAKRIEETIANIVKEYKVKKENIEVRADSYHDDIEVYLSFTLPLTPEELLTRKQKAIGEAKTELERKLHEAKQLLEKLKQ